MYMESIVHAKTGTSSRIHRLVGLPVLALTAPVMFPWLALYALWSATAFTLRALPKAPRTLLTMIDYAGTVALGG